MTADTRERLERALLELFARNAAHLKPGTRLEVPAGDGVLILAVTSGPSAKLTTCERDILDIFEATGRRLTAKEVKAALARVGADWAPSTVANALAALVAMGRLTNPRDRRGYALPITDNQVLSEQVR